jgi:hypothetical protein
LAATERPSAPASSAEMTVILSTAVSGSAAACTTCGSTVTSISRIAASPYLAKASARASSASASACADRRARSPSPDSLACSAAAWAAAIVACRCAAALRMAEFLRASASCSTR